MSVLGTVDLGLFVASGGFTSDAKEEARTQERRKMNTNRSGTLFDLWVEHYPKLTQEATQRLPLNRFISLHRQNNIAQPHCLQSEGQRAAGDELDALLLSPNEASGIPSVVDRTFMERCDVG